MNLIHASPYKVMAFAEMMDMPYKNFNYAVNHKSFDYYQIAKAMEILNCSFEELGIRATNKATEKKEPIGKEARNKEGGAQPSKEEQLYNDAHEDSE